MSLEPMKNDLSTLDESAKYLRQRLGKIPPVVLVAGSGLSGYAQSLHDPIALPYNEIPNFPVSHVVGHAGNLVLGRAVGPDGPGVIVLNGRAHLYEGHDAPTSVFALRVLLRAGARIVLLSNAAGCLNPRYAPGEIMLISDHINFQFKNPLLGPNINELGPRFPDMCGCWDRSLRDKAREAALRLGVVLREGVYIGLPGPSYETKAEVQMLRAWADVVGMSTVAENIAAVHAGARCLGLTVITNSLVHRSDIVTTHEEVLETGRRVARDFERLVNEIILDMAKESLA